MSTKKKFHCIAYRKLKIMSKVDPNIPFDSDVFRFFVKRSEPTLKPSEKEAMFRAIEHRLVKRSKKSVMVWAGAVAASFLLLLGGGWFFRQTANPYQRLFAMVDVDTLQAISLYLDDQKITLPEQAEIRCLPDGGQIEVRSSDNKLFSLASAQKNRKSYVEVAVPAGRKVEVILPDQSHVMLRERTKLVFPLHFDAHERAVHLQGEAYLKVTHLPEKPFITVTDELNVAVLGTEFLVSAYPEQSEQSVLLLSGRVAVEPETGRRTVLRPNQRFTYNKKTAQSVLKSEVDPQPLIGWKEDVLLMKEESLSDVLKRIEAIYAVNFNYDWESLKEVTLNGKLDLTVTVDQLLERLSKIAPITVKKDKRIITIIRSK
ncbi:MAG: FecR family protein [Bacteroidia bacterium]|nr:FecR family protein [Bacteroidia bacterium]